MKIDTGTAFKTHDGKLFPYDRGSTQSRLKAGQAADDHVRHRRATIEAKIGRPLTDAEFFANKVDHVEDRDIITRERDAKFEPVRKEPGKYERMKADILKRIEERDTASLPPLERQLADLERIEAREAGIEADNAAKTAHLANPRVKAALKELNSLLDEMRFDPNRTAGEFQQVENAIKQWEAFDGDTAVAETMIRNILNLEDERATTMNTEKLEQIAKIEAGLMGPRTATPPKVELNRQQPLKDIGHDLFNSLCEVGATFPVLDAVHHANEELAAGNSGPLESLIDQYAVGENETLA